MLNQTELFEGIEDYLMNGDGLQCDDLIGDSDSNYIR